MQLLKYHRNRSGFTLVELMIYMCIGIIISCVTYSFLTGATVLYAKNMSIVHSHTNMRSVLDRLNNNLQQANNRAVLMDTSGNAVATATAAGLYYDRYLGDPYVITNASGTGLPSSTTTVTVTRSTAALAAPPIPAPGDAILISNPNGDVRGLIATSTPGVVDTINKRQPITLTLTAALGTAVTWTSPEIRTAILVHREAFLVVPAGNLSEFRFFKDFEPKPVLTNAANYSVISNQLSVLAGETTPFSIDTLGSDKIVRASLFARSTEFSTYLSTKQAYEFNTFVRLNTVLASRLRPQN